MAENNINNNDVTASNLRGPQFQQGKLALKREQDLISESCASQKNHQNPQTQEEEKQDLELRQQLKKEQLRNRSRLLKIVKRIYRSVSNALAELDFTGKGFIMKQDFILSKPCQQMITFNPREKWRPLSLHELTQLVDDWKLFSDGQQMSNEFFGRTFFPHLVLNDSIKDETHVNPNLKAEDKEDISKRLKLLDERIRLKFSEKYKQVRLAFIDRDSDADGYLIVRDLIQFFEYDNEVVDCDDLRRLFEFKASGGHDHNKKMTYSDFCAWVGSSISKEGGLYFRHDSNRNTEQVHFNEKRLKEREISGFDEAIKKQMTPEQLEELLFTKIRQQWKKISSAFASMQATRQECIDKDKWRTIVGNWGIDMTDEQLNTTFDMLDLDKDGIINQKDFHTVLGPKCFPKEGLYFRQDQTHKQRMSQVVLCKVKQCLNNPIIFSHYCKLHDKFAKQKAKLVLADKIAQLPDASKFLAYLHTNKLIVHEHEEGVLIDALVNVFKIFGASSFTKDQIQFLKDNSPEGLISLQEIKSAVNQGQNTQQIDEPLGEPATDYSGFLGVFHRKQGKLSDMGYVELLDVFIQQPKIGKIFRTLREIDRDGNGLCTKQEIDDIIKLYYPELKDRNLMPVFQEYEDKISPLLVHYKKLISDAKRDVIQAKIKQQSEVMSQTQKSGTGNGLQGLDADLLSALDEDLKSQKSHVSSLCESQLIKLPALNSTQNGRNSKKEVRFQTASQHSKSVDRMSQLSKQIKDDVDYPMSGSQNRHGSNLMIQSVDKSNRRNIFDSFNRHLTPNRNQQFDRTAYSVTSKSAASRSMLDLQKQQNNQVNLERIGNKLKVEWKNIFRQIQKSVDDPHQPMILLSLFTRITADLKVYLTNEEIKCLRKNFKSENNEMLNIELLANKLGLNNAATVSIQWQKQRNMQLQKSIDSLSKISRWRVNHIGQDEMGMGQVEEVPDLDILPRQIKAMI